MDYSKLNNIAASIQDVENTASIVENRLNTKIDEDIQSLQDAISDIGNNPSESIDSNVISAALNDLSDKTDNLTKDVEDLEKTTFSSLNDLNEKVNNLSDEVNDNEAVTAAALTDLDEKTDNNEKVVSAALNDLNEKVDNLNDSIVYKNEIGIVTNGEFEVSEVNHNTYYDLTNNPLTLLDVSNISNINYEIVIKFLTHSSSNCTIVTSNNQRYIGGLTLFKNSVYAMSIFKGMIVIAETDINSI